MGLIDWGAGLDCGGYDGSPPHRCPVSRDDKSVATMGLQELIAEIVAFRDERDVGYKANAKIQGFNVLDREKSSLVVVALPST